MSAAVAEATASQAPNVEALTDATRKELVELRESGMTLAELKTRFPQLTGEQIREVLPPGNKREAKAREPKAPKADQPAAPKAETPKYVTDEKVIEELASGVTRCREKGIGRARLAQLAGVIPMATYRAEVLRHVLSDEVEPLRAAIAKVDSGEVEVRKPSGVAGGGPAKAELTHRIEVATTFFTKARGDRSISKAALIDGALAVLDPKGDQPAS